MEYICKRCGYKTNTKCNLKNHLHRLHICKVKDGFEDIANDILLEELEKKNDSKIKISCDICGKPFSHRSGKSRHMKLCIQINNNIKKLQERIKELESKPNVVINNNNIIVLNSFGYENINYVLPEMMKDCLKEMNLTKLVEHIHFNPDHPENHNVRIKNKKEKLLEYWEEGRWIVDNSDKVLEDCIHYSGFKILKTFYLNNIDDVHKEINEEYCQYNACRLRQQIQLWLKKLEEKDKNLFKKLKKEMIIYFISNKAMVYGR